MMKNLFQNQEFQLDEILFEGRNKSYGAYSLRHDSERVLTKSMFYGLGFLMVVSAVPLLINNLKPKAPNTVITNSGGHVLVDIDPVEPVVPPVVQTTPVQHQTFDSTVPTPVREPKVEKPAASISDYGRAIAGTQNVDGDKPVVTYAPPAVVAPVVTPDPPVVAPAVVPKDLNKIADKVDVEAAFAGGIDAFRGKVQQNFDPSTFEGSGETIRTVVTFVVERDGTISNVKATGPDTAFNREAERTIKNVKGKWAPAKLQGETVRSYFKFPVTMAFE